MGHGLSVNRREWIRVEFVPKGPVGKGEGCGVDSTSGGPCVVTSSHVTTKWREESNSSTSFLSLHPSLCWRRRWDGPKPRVETVYDGLGPVP